MSGNKLTLSADVIRKAARELGMIEPRDEGSVLAAIDDYFITLTDGQYSPMSGEHNNASNQTDVMAIAKKHNVDPTLMMNYLNDIAIYDKFQKMAVTEGMIPDFIGTRVKSKFNPSGYAKFKREAVTAIIKSISSGERNLSSAIHAMSSAYSIPAKELLIAVKRETSAEGNVETMENNMAKKNRRVKNVKHVGDIEGKQKGSNPVQKNLKAVNSGGRHSDKKNDYKRKEKHKGNTTEGYRVLPSIDRDRYQNREHEGLEGPYSNKHGRVYYYDTKAGKYYDPDTDIYLDVDDVMEGKITNALQESVNLFMSLMHEGKEISAHQAKLMNFLDNLGADYLFTGDAVLLEDPVYSEITEKFPEMVGMVQRRGGLKETMAGNIAGGAQPIGDMQRRRGIAELDHEELEDDEEKVEETSDEEEND